VEDTIGQQRHPYVPATSQRHCQHRPRDGASRILLLRLLRSKIHLRVVYSVQLTDCRVSRQVADELKCIRPWACDVKKGMPRHCVCLSCYDPERTHFFNSVRLFDKCPTCRAVLLENPQVYADQGQLLPQGNYTQAQDEDWDPLADFGEDWTPEFNDFEEFMGRSIVQHPENIEHLPEWAYQGDRVEQFTLEGGSATWEEILWCHASNTVWRHSGLGVRRQRDMRIQFLEEFLESSGINYGYLDYLRLIPIEEEDPAVQAPPPHPNYIEVGADFDVARYLQQELMNLGQVDASPGESIVVLSV